MIERPALIDSDVLSWISRGHPRMTRRVNAYLERHGRLTFSAVTVFERLRGYHAAIARGKPFQDQLRQFEMLVMVSVVLPIDERAADYAATLWAHLSPRRRRAIGDILIAASASANGLPLVTRNPRDFEPMTKVPGISLRVLDWSR